MTVAGKKLRQTQVVEDLVILKTEKRPIKKLNTTLLSMAAHQLSQYLQSPNSVDQSLVDFNRKQKLEMIKESSSCQKMQQVSQDKTVRLKC